MTEEHWREEVSQEDKVNLAELLDREEFSAVAERLAEMHPAEIASLLESLPPHERAQLWDLVPAEHDGDVLLSVNDEVRSGLIRHMDPAELVAATEGLDTDDLADILPDLPETVITELLRAMDEQDRQRLESVLLYPEDTAGGIMNVDTISVRADVTVDVVLRYIRFRGALPEMTDNLIVVNREDRFLGVVSLSDLLTKDQGLTIAEIINRDFEPINANTSVHDVTRVFSQRDLVSAPVVDDNNKLLGRITIDDVVDIIREEADHSLMSLAGLDEENDMFAPVVRSSRRRAVWLGVNLLTAFLASWVIGLFDATIEKLVALAVLMPIVASMGGIAGSQTLTLVIRGLALGQIGERNAGQLMIKELSVGLLNGLLWALVVGLVAVAWFGEPLLGVIIGLAIVANLITAALAGATIPLLLQRLGADPALAGSVVLTTITDVVGFAAFLGLAALFLV